MEILQPRQVVVDHRVPLFIRQKRQDRQAALAHAQRHAAADVTGERTDRKRPFTAVQADRIEATARQQKQ
ncbi:hypothetical protein D3C87_1756070 [compost metagenome]